VSASDTASGTARDDRGSDAGKEHDAPAGESDALEADGNADQEQADQQAEADDVAEHTWDSRRDLYRHSPAIMFGRNARVGGSVVGGDQHGVSGGHVHGDVMLGGDKHYHYGAAPEETSGEIPAYEVDELADYFVYPSAPQSGDQGTAFPAPGDHSRWDPQSPFGRAFDLLETRRVVVLAGPASTGRRCAALMLLRAVGARSYRALDAAVAPGRLAGELRDGCGHVVVDFLNNADRPLREHHMRALSEKLRDSDAYLVIVVGPRPVVEGPWIAWRQPEPGEILRGHLENQDLRGCSIDELLALPAVQSVAGHRRPAAELAKFALLVAAFARDEATADTLAGFGDHAAQEQVRKWFDGADQTLHDKAFLISLAAFDEAPFPLMAELSDALFVHLHRVEDRGGRPRMPVFGTSSAQRVDVAQAYCYQEAEESEWGPVLQTKIQFRDRLTAVTLLREVWTGHPSARPALVAWLRQLAIDPRPVVRNRAASAAAVLADADLLSTMALLIQPWAADRRFRPRIAAANTLTLTHHLGTPHVPRILETWCAADDYRLRWTAVRAYGLVGDTFPAAAVAALADTARRAETRGQPVDGWPKEVDDIAQSAAAVILAAGADADDTADTAPELWSAFVPLLRERATRAFALQTMVYAARPTDGDPGSGRPLLLDLFGRADVTPGTPGALLRQSVAELWRAVLNDPLTSVPGLEVLRDWIAAVTVDPDGERTLAQLLPMLISGGEDARRLAYLLEKLRTSATEQPVRVTAGRLRAVLAHPDGPARQHHVPGSRRREDTT
jgi:hypothetical protein